MREQEKVAKPPQLAQTGWCGQELFDHTARVRSFIRRLRCFFLMSSHNDTRVLYYRESCAALLSGGTFRSCDASLFFSLLRLLSSPRPRPATGRSF
jgi:hypothetical protein